MAAPPRKLWYVFEGEVEPLSADINKFSFASQFERGNTFEAKPSGKKLVVYSPPGLPKDSSECGLKEWEMFFLC